MKRSFACYASMAAAALTLLPLAARSQALPALSDTAAPGNAAVYRGGPSHTGFFDVALSSNLAVLWQNTTTATQHNISSPAVSGDTIVFGSGHHVYALGAADGGIKWQYPKDGSAASDDFDCPPTIADGKVYIGSNDSKLYAFDVQTGEVLWRQATHGTILSAPVIDDNAVFFGSSDSTLYAVRLDTQQPLWSSQFHASGPVTTSPVVSGGSVFFVDGASTLYGVNEATGRVMWSYHPVDGVLDGTPILSGATLVIGSGRSVVGLVTRTGSPRWNVTLSTELTAAPVVTSTNIYVATSDESVYCLTTRGEHLWKVTLDDIVTTPLTATRNLVFAVTQQGVLFALDAATGATKWTYRFTTAVPDSPGAIKPTTVTAAPVASGDFLYSLTNDGTLTAFRAAATDMVPPDLGYFYPPSGSTVAGAGIPFQAVVTDAGSGVRADSTSLKVDGATIPVTFNQTTSTVQLKKSLATGAVMAAAIVIPTLTDGDHTAVLTIRDWHGNLLKKTWVFTVDNKQNPPDSPEPMPLKPDAPSAGGDAGAGTGTPGTGGDATGTAASNPGGGLGTVGGPPSGAPAGSPAPNAPGGAAGGPTVKGSGGGPGPTIIPPPTPLPGGGGGGTGNFPPPPPI